MAPGISEYEKFRNKTIAKNSEVLHDLGLPALAAKTLKRPGDKRYVPNLRACVFCCSARLDSKRLANPLLLSDCSCPIA